MRYFLRRLSIFIILLSFVFFGGGAIVSYVENGSILPKSYLIGLNDSEVSISTVNNEGAKGITSSKDTNDVNKTPNNNINDNNEKAFLAYRNEAEILQEGTEFCLINVEGSTNIRGIPLIRLEDGREGYIIEYNANWNWLRQKNK